MKTCSRAIWESVLVLGLVLAGPESVAIRADEPARKQTSEERQLLEKEAKSLNLEALKLRGAGKFAEATRQMERALALFEELYPKDQFPQGHPNLAGGLNNLGFCL